MKRWLKAMGWRKSYWLGLILGLLVLATAPVYAAALSQGYKASQTIAVGALVGLDPSSTDTVQASNTDLVGELFGVVTSSNSSLLAVTGTGTTVQVVTSGTTTALVSNINGDIKKGDAITASPINGVGMKATAAGRIIGLAQDDFSASSSGATSETINTKSGQKQTSIGGIAVAVSLGEYTPKNANSVIPQSVQNLASFLAGRQVSTVRIITAVVLLLIGIVFVVIILNSAVRSSMESIGRNPLAKSAVSSGLFKVLVLTLAILLVTLASVYLVVKG